MEGLGNSRLNAEFINAALPPSPGSLKFSLYVMATIQYQFLLQSLPMVLSSQVVLKKFNTLFPQQKLYENHQNGSI